MKYKYKLADLDCNDCLDKEIGEGRCPHKVCPHITENLKDLLSDPAFIEAVAEAKVKKYDLPQKATLLLLKERKIHKIKKESPVYEKEKPVARYKPECSGCPYPADGFVCYNPKTGSCLKTMMTNFRRR